MTGTLAETIQGEAPYNATPAQMFAVASTIYNRQQANIAAPGSFPGGTDPTAIVNAPLQFTGYSGSPSATAQTFATAIQNGTLTQYGNVGNATNFQSGQTAFNTGIAAGTNIGGNYFSDNLGPPSNDFIAPTYTGLQPATGPDDSSSGLAAGNSSYVGNMGTAGTGDPGVDIPAGVNVTPENPAFDPATVAAADQPASASTCGSGLAGTIAGMTGLCAIAQAIETSFTSLISGIEDWFTRGFLITIGLALILVSLIFVFGKEVKKALPVPA